MYDIESFIKTREYTCLNYLIKSNILKLEDVINIVLSLDDVHYIYLFLMRFQDAPIPILVNELRERKAYKYLGYLILYLDINSKLSNPLIDYLKQHIEELIADFKKADIKLVKTVLEQLKSNYLINFFSEINYDDKAESLGIMMALYENEEYQIIQKLKAYQEENMIKKLTNT